MIHLWTVLRNSTVASSNAVVRMAFAFALDTYIGFRVQGPIDTQSIESIESIQQETQRNREEPRFLTNLRSVYQRESSDSTNIAIIAIQSTSSFQDWRLGRIDNCKLLEYAGYSLAIIRNLVKLPQRRCSGSLETIQQKQRKLNRRRYQRQRIISAFSAILSILHQI